MALRREVTSGVSSRTGDATQISQFPLQSRCCLVRGSGFTSQNCQITHFLLLFCPPPLPTRSLLYSDQLLRAFSRPLFWNSSSLLQFFFTKSLCSSCAHYMMPFPFSAKIYPFDITNQRPQHPRGSTSSATNSISLPLSYVNTQQRSFKAMQEPMPQHL